MATYPNCFRRSGVKFIITAHSPFEDAPAFMQKLSEQPGLGANALKFTVLTAARTADVVGAKWSEFDLKNKLWTVPAAH